MLVLAGKILFGLSLGMASSFVLGATSVGLWTLAWPVIAFTGSVGVACWLMGKAIGSVKAGSGGAKGSDDHSESPPPYTPPFDDKGVPLDLEPEPIKKSQPKKQMPLSTPHEVTPPASPHRAPSIFVTPPRFSSLFSSRPATIISRGPTVVPTYGTPHPRVEVRRTVAPIIPSRVLGVPGATTVRHVGTRSVRVR